MNVTVNNSLSTETVNWCTLNKFNEFYLFFLISFDRRNRGKRGQYCVFPHSFLFFSVLDVLKVGWYPNRLYINIHPDKSPTFIFLHFRFLLICITPRLPLSTFWGILYNVLKSRLWDRPWWNTNYLSSLSILSCEVKLLCFKIKNRTLHSLKTVKLLSAEPRLNNEGKRKMFFFPVLTRVTCDIFEGITDEGCLQGNLKCVRTL